jgi:hypothetical protein
MLLSLRSGGGGGCSQGNGGCGLPCQHMVVGMEV